MNKFSPAYDAGFSSKKAEIDAMGFEAARDKFNIDCPVGVKWSGSQEGLDYSKGEMAALEQAAPKNHRQSGETP